MDTQLNDLNMRLHMMKSLKLDNLPTINPNSIDETIGIIAKETVFLKTFNFEKLLENSRRR